MKHFTLTIALCLALGTASQLLAQNLDSGLVVYYPFENSIKDSISGMEAVTNGNFTFKEGRVGESSLRFFNEESYFLTPEGALVPGMTPASFALWVNHRSTELNAQRQNYIQQLNGGGSTGRATLYLQRPDSPTNPDSIISFVGNATSKSNYKLTEADVWIHLALTIDPVEREFIFYVNGQETNRDTLPGDKQVEPSTGSYVIGHHKELDKHTLTFHGMMDELRFYNRILTAEEVALLAETTVGTREVLARAALPLSPNPAGPAQRVTIGVDQGVFAAGAPLHLSVIDATGRVVLQQRYDRFTDRVTLDHRLRAGTYTLSLTNGKRLAASTLVVR